MPHDYLQPMPMHEDRELPQFTLRQVDLPEILQWEVGGQYYIVMKVEQIATRNRKDMDAPKSDRAKLEADFQVLSIRALGEQPIDVKTLERREFEETVAKVKSGQL